MRILGSLDAGCASAFDVPTANPQWRHRFAKKSCSRSVRRTKGSLHRGQGNEPNLRTNGAARTTASIATMSFVMCDGSMQAPTTPTSAHAEIAYDACVLALRSSRHLLS